MVMQWRDIDENTLEPITSQHPLPVALVDQNGNQLFAAGLEQGDVNNMTPAEAADILDALMVGRYDSTLPTITNGRFNALQLDARGALHVALMDGDGTSIGGIISLSSDGASASGRPGLLTASAGFGFNGTTLDRWRNNMDLTLLASAARTTTQTSADLVNYNADALIVVVDITAYTAGSLTITIDRKDETSGKYVNLLTSAALAAQATTVLQVGPVIAAAANTIALAYMPRTFRIVATVGDATSITYSIGYSLVRAR